MRTDFLKSAQELKERVGATDEEMGRYLEAVAKNRIEKYSKRLIEKYPLSLNRKAQEYFASLSPMEQAEISPEDAMIAAIEANPDNFTAEEIGSIFGKDGHRKPLTPGIYDTPLRDYDRAKYENENVLVEAPPEPPPQREEAISFEQARSKNQSPIG